MSKWGVLVTMLVVGCAGSLGVGASGSLSGGVSFWMAFDPNAGQFDALDLELEASYSIDTITIRSESVIAFPGTWVWQGFSAQGVLGAYRFESNILFGASTAEYLYAEAIASLPIGGIDLAWHAAQLGDAVFGGPEGGWALKLSGKIGGFDLTSITEFGARIEDEDVDGISIVHIATGLEQHYATDPRPAGEEFSGQKISLSRPNVLCSDLVEGTLYGTGGGFDYLQFDVEGLEIGLPFFALDAELRFELADKTIALASTL